MKKLLTTLMVAVMMLTFAVNYAHASNDSDESLMLFSPMGIPIEVNDRTSNDLVDVMKESVVFITTVRVGNNATEGEGPGLIGTGFILEDGYIMTNYHVAPEYNDGKSTNRYFIQFYNQKTPAYVVEGKFLSGTSDTDLSILTYDKTYTPTPYKDIKQEFVNNYAINSTAHIIGHPVVKGVPNKYEHLSGPLLKRNTTMLRTIPAANTNDNLEVNITMDEYDIPIIPGFSGSPIFNDQGQIIGVASGYRWENSNRYHYYGMTIPASYAYDLASKSIDF